MSSTPQYIGQAFDVTATAAGTRIDLPDLTKPPLKGQLPTQSIVRLLVRESAGPTELVSEAGRTEGLPIPTTSVGTAFQAGTWRLGPGLTLYLYAATDTVVTLVAVYEARSITGE